jgi:hypothetical protein
MSPSSGFSGVRSAHGSATAPQQALPGNKSQGEQKSNKDRSKRDRNLSSTPAAASLDTIPTDRRSSHPLFALSSSLPDPLKNKWPGQILWALTKAQNIRPPAYGSGDNKKNECFDFATAGFAKCDGTHQGPGKPKIACDRLHLSLDATSNCRSDSAAYFAGIAGFLRDPKVADYFTPSDELATLQQYLDAVASL